MTDEGDRSHFDYDVFDGASEGVDAAGEADHHPPQVAEQVPEPGDLEVEGVGHEGILGPAAPPARRGGHRTD